MGRTFRDRAKAGGKLPFKRRGRNAIGQGALVATECSTKGCSGVEMVPEDMDGVLCAKCTHRLAGGGALPERGRGKA